ncbi:MAG: copper amine oxidase N-terminal domain-containing protein [Methanocorpusculum sp.]|nr:copper amine oxidase N-terminal domain-containing protein [Methanocorpusculum sp.]
MKRIKIITLVTLLCFIFTIPAFAAIDWDKEPKNYDVKVFADNKDNEVVFPDGMGKPFIAEGRTFVPYRIMCEALGANVDWDGTARKVTAMGNNSKVELFIGNSNYRVNGAVKKMDVEPFILKTEGRTYIPARYLTEGLDYTIDFAQDGKIMYICSFTKGQSEAEMKAILDEIVEANKQPKVDKQEQGVKKAVIDTSKYKEPVQLKDKFPEFYDVDVKHGIAGFFSNSKHRFVCTNHPELNEYAARYMGGGDYIERNDDLTNQFVASYGLFDGKLKEGMTLKYDVFNADGVKIYDLTLQF